MATDTFDVGQFFIVLFGVGIIAYFAAYILRKLLRQLFLFVSKRRKKLHERLHREGVEVNDTVLLDETKYRVLTRFVSGVIYVFGASVVIYSVPSLRTLSYSLLVGAGVAAVIIGFALQKSLANLVSGIFLALYEPIRIGDTVTIDGKYGTIEDITLRHTVIRNWENKRWIIPNSTVADAVIENYTIVDSKFLKVITVNISYESDTDLARKIILEEISKRPEVIIPEKVEKTTLVKQEPFVRVSKWFDSGIELQVGFWCRSIGESWGAGFALLESVKNRFLVEGVEIPYPHRVNVPKMKQVTKRKRKTRRS